MSAIVKKYRVHCDTEPADHVVWSTTEPTTCPINAAHTIDSAKTVIIGGAGASQSVSFKNPDVPHDLDGKPVFVMSPSTRGWRTWLCGAGDQLTPTVKRGKGEIALMTFTVGNGEEITKELQFAEPIEVHDGQGTWRPVADWDLGDVLEVSVTSPATSVIANGGGTGNCNLVDLGGYNAVVPAAGDGAYDLDVPVPLLVDDEQEPDGYWDVDKVTGVVTAALPGEGNCSLLDIPIEGFMMREIQIGHEHGVMDIDVYKVEWIHQTQKLKVRVVKNSAGAGKFAFWALAFRKVITE
jgi:hypothetical protein